MPRFVLLSSLIALSLGAGIVGCGSSSSVGPGSGDEPDAGTTSTGPSTFTDVWAIMSNSSEGDCGDCHGGAKPSAGLVLKDQADAYTTLVGQPPLTTTENTCEAVGTSEGLDLVKPGDAAHSLLYLKISEATPPCGTRMPRNRPMLTAAEIAVFESWINAGAKND